MPTTMTKAELKKLLVQERASMRSKHKQSAFMRKTLSIYNGQRNRMREETGDAKMPFTLEQLRADMEKVIGTMCCYCGETKLSVKNVTADHVVSIAAEGSWEIENLVYPCSSCQWQKGRLSGAEFRSLMKFGRKYLSVASFTDLKRRLTIGGKWSFK